MTGVVVPVELELLELDPPEVLDRLEVEEPELPLEPELLVLEPELPLELELAIEPELELLELELPLPWRTIVPVKVGLVLSGVTVSVLPDAQ